MKKILLYSLTIFLLTSCTNIPTKWDEEDKKQLGLFVIGQGVNYAFIDNIYDSPKVKEANPFLNKIHRRHGMKGIAAWKIGSTAGIGVLAHYLKPTWRKTLLKGSSFLVWFLNSHDFCIEVKIKLKSLR